MIETTKKYPIPPNSVPTWAPSHEVGASFPIASPQNRTVSITPIKHQATAVYLTECAPELLDFLARTRNQIKNGRYSTAPAAAAIAQITSSARQSIFSFSDCSFLTAFCLCTEPLVWSADPTHQVAVSGHAYRTQNACGRGDHREQGLDSVERLRDECVHRHRERRKLLVTLNRGGRNPRSPQRQTKIRRGDCIDPPRQIALETYTVNPKPFMSAKRLCLT